MKQNCACGKPAEILVETAVGRYDPVCVICLDEAMVEAVEPALRQIAGDIYWEAEEKR